MRYKRAVYLILLVLTIILLTQSKINAQNSDQNADLYQRNVKTGSASWYSETDPGINIHTANNEIFDDTGLTAAMWDVPFNQTVRVTNTDNGKSVTVRINDRGPHRRFVRKGRIIDLTKQAFSNIASLEEGLINIELELL